MQSIQAFRNKQHGHKLDLIYINIPSIAQGIYSDTSAYNTLIFMAAPICLQINFSEIVNGRYIKM
jgi:hypothetical protein